MRMYVILCAIAVTVMCCAMCYVVCNVCNVARVRQIISSERLQILVNGLQILTNNLVLQHVSTQKNIVKGSTS